MPTLYDEEFGIISIRRSAQSRAISIKIAPNGTLRMSAPLYTPTFLMKRFLEESREKLRHIRIEYSETTVYSHGMQLGKSHKLVVVSDETIQNMHIAKQKRELLVKLPPHQSLELPEIQQVIQQEYKKILNKEARAYLPRRLLVLAKRHGFHYKKVRYSHASSRWGSCSSGGTISLNIALMKLPHELIDYVLIHELCHTREMNHSSRFWQLLESCHPDYKQHRKLLKQHHPFI